MDSREVFGSVTVSCFTKVKEKKLRAFFLKVSLPRVIFPSLDFFFQKKNSHHGITIMRDWDISFPWLG